MSAGVSNIDTRPSYSIWRNTAAWMRTADISVALLAASLPWSTSLVAIFAVVWLITLIPTAEAKDFVVTLKRPVCVIPILLFVLAAIATLWASDIPWASRLHSVNPVAKLLAIPILIRHFEKSERGLWIALAFLASCAAVMLTSWAMFFVPGLALDPTKVITGVPVKNTIAQSQEFTLCAFGALGGAVYAWSRQSKTIAMLLVALSAGFILNMLFVANSRTALACIPLLLILFVAIHLNRRNAVLLLIGAVVAGVLAWNTSPYLRIRVDSALSEYQSYHPSGAVTSSGQRLEFWRKSVKFFQAAPVLGHGTGSTKTLFERDAVGQSGVSAEVIANPHNQTLNVAVQWGALGVVLLFAMWLVHLRLFAGKPGLVAWIGLAAVTENIFSSLFNSHLFDFTEGWMYVLAVGVAGGIVLRGDPLQTALVPGARQATA